MGQEYDMERHPSGSRAELQSVSKGHCARQESDASGRDPPGAPSGVAQVGYSDPSSFYSLMGELLFGKSPIPRSLGLPQQYWIEGTLLSRVGLVWPRL